MSRYTLHHADALAALLTIPTGSVDAIVTDPPYSSGGLHKGDRSKSTADKYVIGGSETAAEQGRPDFSGDQRDQRAFGYWCSLWIGECFRTAKDGALLAVFCDWRQLPTMTDVIQAGGWVWRGIVPWNKTAATRPNKGWYRAQCEYVIVAAKGTPAMWGSESAPALEGFMVCPVERGQLHQTQKPLSLMRWLVGVVPRGGRILDPFTGSGSTGVAALLEGFEFIGVEQSAEIFEIARKRLEEAATQGTQQDLGLEVLT